MGVGKGKHMADIIVAMRDKEQVYTSYAKHVLHNFLSEGTTTQLNFSLQLSYHKFRRP